MESTIATNISLQATNRSATDLNFQTKKYYRQLEIATWVIAVATVLNIAATVTPIMFRTNDDKGARVASPAQDLEKSKTRPVPDSSMKPKWK